MSPESLYPPLEGPIIQRIILLDRITRPQRTAFESDSLPGHLLHFVTEGEVRQITGGRMQHLTPGKAVWYYENEPVTGEVLCAPMDIFHCEF